MYSRSIKMLFFGVIAFVFVPNTVFGAGFDLVNITTSPQNPVAGKSVTVSIESYAVDLSTANIAWMLNGEYQQDGVAMKTFTFTAPEFGEKAVVDIVILPAQGEKIDKQYIVAPAEVDLLWEAQTYTPPFYKGKALPTFNSNVRITAIPRVGKLASDPSQFYYKWAYNIVSGAGEALGKNSVTIPMGFTSSQLQVVADVSLPDSPWKGRQGINIAVASPKVVLFENDPLYGVRLNLPVKPNTAITSSEPEVTLFAVPYFFSSDDLLNDRLVYKWEIDHQTVTPGGFPRSLTLVKPEKVPTTYAVSLRVQNPNRILQEGHANASVQFTDE